MTTRPPEQPATEPMRNTAYIRYTVAVVALMLGFAFSIRFSERGFLFESTTTDAHASETADPDAYDLVSLAILNRALLQLKDNYVEPERIDRMISGIVRRLESLGEAEIPSSVIGEMVMEGLANLDPVAYVRFASVYRNFREAKDFEEFIGELGGGEPSDGGDD